MTALGSTSCDRNSFTESKFNTLETNADCLSGRCSCRKAGTVPLSVHGLTQTQLLFPKWNTAALQTACAPAHSGTNVY